ncbi:outer membrane protein assembly factor BamB family protein [Sphingomonas sp. YL-JM2C]
MQRIGRGLATMSLAIAAAVIGAGAVTGQPVSESEALEKTRIRSTDDFQAKDASAVDPATAPGKAIFAEHCAVCHEGGVPKAPSPTFLAMMPGDAIVAALTGGVMKAQGAALSPAQRIEVAEFVTRRRLSGEAKPKLPPVCTGARLAFDAKDPPRAVGWGHDNRRFIPSDMAKLAAADVPKLALKWAYAFPGALRARSQPGYGWGTMFVGSQDGTVYAFDLDSGCTKWTRRVSAEIRTAIVADAATKRLYFGDLLGRAYALDAFTGKILWSEKLDDHPDATITGTPTLGGGLLYVPVSSLEVAQPADPKYACCSFRGSVVALDPATGAVRWRAYTVPQPPTEQGRNLAGTPILGPSGAPVWNSPTYDAEQGRVYFGSGENYSSPADDNSDAVFAVDARTGRRLWHTQLTKGDAWNVACMLGSGSCPKENGPDHDVAASTLLIPIGGGRRMLVIGQKSGEAWGLDPDSGRIAWQRQLGHGGTQGGVHFGMAADGTRVFVPINDMPDTGDARVYDASIRGSGLHAIDAATGRVIWNARAPEDCAGRKFCDTGISAAVTAIPGVVFAGHLDGTFRAYDAATGTVLWQVDTTRPVPTITGIEGKGGSMSGPGALVVDGHVVINSGYGMYSHMAGNLLMVFAPAQ